MADDSAEFNDFQGTSASIPSTIGPSTSLSTSTEQHPRDVTAKLGAEPMAFDSSQIPEDGPHIPSCPDLTHRPSSDVPITLSDVDEDKTLVPAGKNMTAQENTQMPDISADMADRLLQAIEADGLTADDKDDTTVRATNTSANVEAESNHNNDTSQNTEESASNSARTATNPENHHHMQDEVIKDTGGRVEGAEVPDRDEDIDLDEDFDAEAYIRDGPPSKRGPNGTGGRADDMQRVTLDEADAWMHDFNPEEDEDADREAHERYLEAKRYYERKRRAETITEEEEITWLSIEKAEKSRNKVRIATMEAEFAAQQEEMDEDTLDINDLFYPDEPLTPAATSETKKRSRQESGHHVNDSDREDGQPSAKKTKSTKKKGAANSSAKRAAKDKTKPKGKAPAVKVKKLTKKQKQQMRNAGMFTNLEGLTNGNMFRDIENNTGATYQPTFTSTKKPQALKELIASIPLEHRDENQMDAKAIFSAAKHFTPATSCRPDGEGGWKVNGMVSSLSHYQMLGTSFMRKQETQDVEEPRGGIVADGMGLGKTVMMIANIVNGKNLARNQGPTLIVAPSSLIHQWHAEYMKHADYDKKALGRVTRYCAGHRGGVANSDGPELEEYLSNFQLIITSYADISASYPKSDVPLGMEDPVEKQTWWDNYYEEHKGAFHRIKFHRVVLDEAHAIKNQKSMTSIACRALKGTHRWAISGTPSQNSLSEFYPYFKFLHMPGTGDFKAFKTNYCTEDDPSGSQRLAAMLRKVMLRRTHQDVLMGAKLLPLPDSDRRDHACQLSDIERGIYEVVHNRFVKRINVLARKGELKKQYSNVLVMLLRLRQLVAHPLLIQDTIKDLLEPEDFLELERVINAPTRVSSSEAATLMHLRRMLRSPKDLVSLDSVKDLAESAAQNCPIIIEDDGAKETSKKKKSKEDKEVEADVEADIPIKEEAEEELYMPFPKRAELTEPREVVDLTDDLDDVNFDKEQPAQQHRKKPTKPTKKSSVEPIDLTDVQDEDQGSASHPISIDEDEKDKAKTAKFDDSNTGGAFGLRNSYGDWMTEMKTQAALEDDEPVTECAMCHKPPKRAVMTSCNHTYCYACLRDLSNACRDRGELMTKCISCDEYCSMLRKNTSSNMFTKGVDATHDEEDKKKKKPSIKSVIDTWVDEKGMMLPSAKTLAFKAQVMNWLQQDPTVKIIVYSQFLTMIRIFAKVCEMEHWPCLQYTGSQSIDRRHRTLTEFATDPNQRILLASLRSGGTGLNLTCASRVLLVDLWWNSSVEQQAFARTYRRGQDKETAMTRLIAANTVDEQMVRMQQRKETEINGVMVSERLKRKLTLTELMGLFGKIGEDEQGRSFILVEEQKRRVERFGEDDEDGGHGGNAGFRRGGRGRRG